VLQIAEEKQHGDIVKLVTELMHTDDEVDIIQKDEVRSSNRLSDCP
jgi:hypothetical protein